MTNFPIRGEADKRIGAYDAPLRVTAQDVPNLTAMVRAGSFFNSDNVLVEFAGGSTPIIPVPASGNAWVVIGITNNGTLTIISGAPAATPSVPQIPAGTLPLAAVYVTAGMTAIHQRNICDIRPTVMALNSIPNLTAELSNRPTFDDMNAALDTKVNISDGVPPHRHQTTDVNNLSAEIAAAVATSVAGKANDADVVHNSGNETIGGNKVFTGNVTFQPAGYQPVSFFSTQTADAGDAGVTVARGSKSPAVMKWDETSLTWQAGIVGENVSTILTAANFDAKADKVVGGVTGNVAVIAADGNYASSNLAVTDVATNAAVDTAIAAALDVAVLEQSQVTNLVADLAGKADVVALNNYVLTSNAPSIARDAVFTTVPATATSTGTAGMLAWDTEYLYVCVDTDTWKRTNLTSW